MYGDMYVLYILVQGMYGVQRTTCTHTGIIYVLYNYYKRPVETAA